MLQSFSYFDNNATTPLDERVLDAMLPYLKNDFGNAASQTHQAGWIAASAIKKAREQVAALIHSEPDEIYFTSGATESINIALQGLQQAFMDGKNHLITCATEHKAVLDTCKYLQSRGAEITFLSVNREGRIDLNELESFIKKETFAVCIMTANNETGTLQPINDIGNICQSHDVILMSDATQALGKMNVDVMDFNVHVLAGSAHKFYGPKGAGILYLRRKNPRVKIPSLFFGGGHENGMRPGTQNVAAIVGMGAAAEIAMNEMWNDAQRLSAIRTIFEQSITEHQNAFVNGSIKNRLPQTTNICFKNISAVDFIKKFPQFGVATGSACTSALNEPSHVLMAMGLSQSEAQKSIRFSFGRMNSNEEIQKAMLLISEFINS